MKMKKQNKILGISVVILIVMCAIFVGIERKNENDVIIKETQNSYDFAWLETLKEIESDELRTFESYEEFKEYLNETKNNSSYNGYERKIGSVDDSVDSSYSTDTSDYSTTNIQVKGVDEADIVKTDGKYIYSISDGNIVIVKANPALELKVFSEIKADNYFYELFLNKNKLIVFESDDNYQYQDYEYFRFPYYSSSNTNIKVFDITDRTNPILTQNVSISGNYFNSRMIGNYVYIITSQYPYYYYENITLPTIKNNNEKININATEIKYFNDSAKVFSYTNIVSLNINSQKINYDVFLFSANEMYVSPGNIFLTYSKYYEGNGTTVINRFTVLDGKIRYTGVGKVPGRILNQFSMDEHEKYFRIATTTGNSWDSTSMNHLYILNDKMNVAGKVEDLAKGETIYSARFMGKRAYIVTFKKVDPLFVIDVENPKNPKVLGYLKITGYSDYLHPYDENHIIGIGKETAGGNERFSWYQGVKISLFDVSNVSKPIEKAKIEIGDRGTDSEALREHKAVLFSKNKNLLVLPITLAEINESKYDGDIPDNAYGEYVWNGAFVLNINENEISERGRITHEENFSEDRKYRYYRGENMIRRSLYIEENLYTISNNIIKVNGLKNLDNIGKIEI